MNFMSEPTRKMAMAQSMRATAKEMTAATSPRTWVWYCAWAFRMGSCQARRKEERREKGCQSPLYFLSLPLPPSLPPSSPPAFFTIPYLVLGGKGDAQLREGLGHEERHQRHRPDGQLPRRAEKGVDISKEGREGGREGQVNKCGEGL